MVSERVVWLLVLVTDNIHLKLSFLRHLDAF